MKILSIADRAEVSGTRRTADGYLVAECRAARGDNIQIYLGGEIGEGAPNQEFRVYRPADEVFRADSLASYSNKPVTLNHPAAGVSPENFRDEGVGHIGSEIVRDGEFVKVPLILMDAKTIAAVEGGTREISMGYDCELVMQPGVTTDGRPYDAYQKNIRINHLAVVPAGRAGPQCRIGDASSQLRTPQQQKDTPAMKTVTIDGKATEVTDEVAAHIAKLTADAKGTLDTLKDGLAVFDDAKAMLADMKAKQEANDKALADAKAELEAAKKAVPTADQLHAMAEELATVVDAAKRIAPELDVKGKTADAIKLAAVTHIVGDDAVKGKSADYIAATFDHLMNTNDADPVAKALASNKGITDAGDKAFNDYRANLSKAWQTPHSAQN